MKLHAGSLPASDCTNTLKNSNIAVLFYVCALQQLICSHMLNLVH